MARFKSDVAQEAYEDLLQENQEQLRDLMDKAEEVPNSRIEILKAIPEISVKNKAVAFKTAFEMDLMAVSAAASMSMLSESAK